MDNLIFICAQPHDPYFQWQCEVLITNFREHKISDKMHILIWHPVGNIEKGWNILVKKYKEVKFFFYEDRGINPELYIPQLRPHILKMHFAKYEEEFKNKMFFYHDCDIIFNYLPDFQKLMEGEIVWESDTSSYLDFSYLIRKEAQGKIPLGTIVNSLAVMTGITGDIIQSYDGNSGGAQYLLKGIDSKFWEDVERDCLSIRRYLMEVINKKYFVSENEGFQSWCADMWAVNFNLWKRSIPTQVTKDLDFSWATDSIEQYYKKPIFHNAGATRSTKMLFYKGSWIQKSPIGVNIKGVSPLFASSKYLEAIKKVK